MNWYVSRERLKAALDATTAINDGLIDRHIEAASRLIDGQLGRFFIPKTQTRYYRPPHAPCLRLDEGLISVSAITSQNGDNTLAVTDYLIEPANEGPPYTRIELDASSVASTADLSAGDTAQRAIAVTGSWGYRNDTESAGTVASGLASDAAATSMVCSSAAAIDVGDTLLIGTEQLWVSERSAGDLGKNTAGALTASMSDVTLAVEAAHGLVAGEVILVDAEKMLIQSIATNTLTLRRAWDGTTLATHANPSDIYVYRTLTVTRGVNGTLAAVHPNTTAISRYRVPGDIEEVCRAEAVFALLAEQSGHVATGLLGTQGGSLRPTVLASMWGQVRAKYGRALSPVI